MSDKSTLVGYVRKSNSGKAVKLSVDVDAFSKADVYEGKDGRKFVALVVNTDNLGKVMSGEKPVTSISQMLNPDDEPAA